MTMIMRYYIQIILLGCVYSVFIADKYDEPLFKFPTNNVGLPNELKTHRLSEPFKIGLVVMRMYSKVRRGTELKLLGYHGKNRKYPFQSNSIYIVLSFFMRNGMCVKYSKTPIYEVGYRGIPRAVFVCLKKIKFEKIERRYSTNGLLEKNNKRIIVAYMFKEMGTRFKMPKYELVILIRLQMLTKANGSVVYECEYLNANNEIKEVILELDGDKLKENRLQILVPWYYIS